MYYLFNKQLTAVYKTPKIVGVSPNLTGELCRVSNRSTFSNLILCLVFQSVYSIDICTRFL